MHPLLGGTRLRGYLAIWVFVGLFWCVFLTVTTPLGVTGAILLALPLALVYGFICLAAWYPVRAAPLQRATALRLVATHVVGALLSSALLIALGSGWSSLLSLLAPLRGLSELYQAATPIVFAVGVFAFLLSVSAHYVLLAFEGAREAETRALSLAVLAREAELKALSAQINPHFLFNSLNAVSALTSADPVAARRMCVLLADFLRLALAQGPKDTLPLADELALVESFLAIEQVRLGGRLHVVVDVDEPSRRCLVPPLILQPLVENAVRHGIGNRLEGGVVRVEAKKKGGRVELVVENPRDPEAKPGRGLGLGLKNVKGRLERRYGADASFDVLDGAESFRVALSLPLTTGSPQLTGRWGWGPNDQFGR